MRRKAREFAKEMVADHKRDVAAFEKESKRKNAPTAAFAGETLPTLRHHLETSQGLAAGKSASPLVRRRCPAPSGSLAAHFEA